MRTLNHAQDDSEAAAREIHRLKWNWFFLIALTSLDVINYSSPLSTLHQFIINPTAQILNGTTVEATTEHGLGLSETFYAWTIAAFSIGEFVGALSAGILTNIIPFWHNVLIGILAHTFGYLLYALATEGWMMIISRLLTGTFVGMQSVTAFTYFGVSYEKYLQALGEGRKEEEGKTVRVKDTLFALFALSSNMGHLIGPGAAVIISQLPISHFRSIGWFKIIMGIAFIFLEVITFRGECSCPGKTNCSEFMKSAQCTRSNINVTVILIVLFLILTRGVITAKFIVYEELLNPILSDSFGFTEKEASYFFLALLPARLGSAFLVLVLQRLKFNSCIITILGIAFSMIGLTIMADWQSIPHDMCTHYSLYHHPELATNYSTQSLPVGLVNQQSIGCQILNVDSCASGRASLQKHSCIPNFHPELITCQVAHSCAQCTDSLSVKNSPLCMFFTVSSQEVCFRELNTTMSSEQTGLSILCIGDQFQTCTRITDSTTRATENEIEMEMFRKHILPLVHTQALQIVDSAVYEVAMNRCESFHNSEYHCHWIPNSEITRSHCDDCQPICRSEYGTLNFVQFCIGVFEFLLTISLSRIAVVMIISDIVVQDFQGIVMGLAYASTGVFRSFTPIYLDAAYEGVQKRTFLAMAVMTCLLAPFLVMLILLYPKLGKLRDQQIATSSSVETGDDEDSTELSELMPRQTDSDHN